MLLLVKFYLTKFCACFRTEQCNGCFTFADLLTAIARSFNMPEFGVCNLHDELKLNELDEFEFDLLCLVCRRTNEKIKRTTYPNIGRAGAVTGKRWNWLRNAAGVLQYVHYGTQMTLDLSRHTRRRCCCRFRQQSWRVGIVGIPYGGRNVISAYCRQACQCRTRQK